MEVEFGIGVAAGRGRFIAYATDRWSRGGGFGDESVPARTLTQLQIELGLRERNFGFEKCVFIGAEFLEHLGGGRETARSGTGAVPARVVNVLTSPN